VETTSPSTLALWTTIVKLPNQLPNQSCRTTDQQLGVVLIRAANWQTPALPRPQLSDPGALRRRPGGPGFHVAEHRLFQLRIHFICGGYQD